MGIVDGYTGKLYIEPDEETMKKYEAKKAEDENKKRLLLELKGKENVTLDAKKLIFMPISAVLRMWQMH